MEYENSLMKKDLSIILKINEKMNYADITKVQKVHDEIIQKGMFKTNLGTRYIERLKQIIADIYNDKCIFCGKTIANTEDTVLCDECLKKYEKVIDEKLQTSSPDSSKENIQLDFSKGKAGKTAIPKAESKDSKKYLFVGIIGVVILISIISAIGIDKIYQTAICTERHK